VISVATSIIKISAFGAAVITTQVLAFAIQIGAIALPGAFFAKAFCRACRCTFTPRSWMRW
jgi:hypothetical protein